MAAKIPKIKEEIKVANHDWVDHQASSLLQSITVIAIFYNGMLI